MKTLGHLAIALTLGLLAGVSIPLNAQNAQTILLPWGRVEMDTNEFSLLSTVEDPAAFRCAAPSGISVCKWSGGRLRSDGRQVEFVSWQIKQDERTRHNPMSYAGEVTLHISNGGDADADMRHVMTLRHDGVRFHVPVCLRDGACY